MLNLISHQGSRSPRMARILKPGNSNVVKKVEQQNSYTADKNINWQN